MDLGEVCISSSFHVRIFLAQTHCEFSNLYLILSSSSTSTWQGIITFLQHNMAKTLLSLVILQALNFRMCSILRVLKILNALDFPIRWSTIQQSGTVFWFFIYLNNRYNSFTLTHSTYNIDSNTLSASYLP